MSLEMMKGQIQEIQGLSVSWKRKESGELKIARWVRGGRESKWKSLEENQMNLLDSFEDDDRIFYLSKNLGSGWNYKTEALISSWG